MMNLSQQEVLLKALKGVTALTNSQLDFFVPSRDFDNWGRWLVQELGMTSLITMGLKALEDGHEVYCIWHHWETDLRVLLRTQVKVGERLPALSVFKMQAGPFQSHINEETNIEFLNFHPQPMKKLAQDELALPLQNFNPNLSEKPYPEQSFVWKKYDLFHPFSEGLLEWYGLWNGDALVDAKTVIGFQHQGLEKQFIGLKLTDFARSLRGLKPSAPFLYEMAVYEAFETKMNICLPDRALALRMIALETIRIISHLETLQRSLLSLQPTAVPILEKLKKNWIHFLERWGQSSRGADLICLGGVSSDLPVGWGAEYQMWRKKWEKNWQEFRLETKTLLNKSTFKGKQIFPFEAIGYGLTGPTLRATGINLDLRKLRPKYFYQDVDFEVPVGLNGNYINRLEVLLEEVNQSQLILNQVLDNLPLGPLFEEIDVHVSGKPQTFFETLEGPAGELGVLYEVDTALNISHFRLLTPSWRHIQAWPILHRGLSERESSRPPS